MKILLLFIFTTSLWAETILCPRPVTISGIDCCPDRIQPEQCQKLIEKYLTQEDLERIERVQADIDAGISDTPHYYPNCFWNAIATILPDFFEKARFVSAPEISALLEENFTRISQDSLSTFDLIEFFEYGKEKIFEGKGKYVWRPLERPAHVAVYLEKGIIFQKENFINTTFTIDTVEHTYETLHKEYNKKKHHFKSELELRYHRLAN